MSLFHEDYYFLISSSNQLQANLESLGLVLIFRFSGLFPNHSLKNLNINECTLFPLDQKSSL
jgi:hypothetical protein